MNRLGFFLASLTALNVLFPGITAADEKQRRVIEEAISISRLTGRPILAVAGSNT